jgi:DNA-binding MurR/RpiR family transcriptional regulator
VVGALTAHITPGTVVQVLVETGEQFLAGEFVTVGIASLEQLHEAVAPADLAAAVRILSAASNIYTLGQRRSFTVAYYLAYALTQLDLNAHLLDSLGGMLRDRAELVGPKDALIVMSFRNYTPEVIEIAQACHARKVPVIAITDHALSPLAPHASVCFQIEEKSSKPFGMLAGPVCFAQALVVAVGEQISK